MLVNITEQHTVNIESHSHHHSIYLFFKFNCDSFLFYFHAIFFFEHCFPLGFHEMIRLVCNRVYLLSPGTLSVSFSSACINFSLELLISGKNLIGKDSLFPVSIYKSMCDICSISHLFNIHFPYAIQHCNSK